MITARPLWGNILVRAIKEPETNTTKNGIEIPNASTPSNTITGIVISTGSGSLAFDGSPIPMEIRPGDTVVFKKYEAEEISLNKEKLWMVDQRQVIGVLYQDEGVSQNG